MKTGFRLRIPNEFWLELVAVLLLFFTHCLASRNFLDHYEYSGSNPFLYCYSILICLSFPFTLRAPAEFRSFIALRLLMLSIVWSNSRSEFFEN